MSPVTASGFGKNAQVVHSCARRAYNFTPEEREAYKDHLKWLRIEANTSKNYEQRGETKGRAEGKVEGKAERNIEIAKTLLLEGDSVEKIIKITGLSMVSYLHPTKNSSILFFIWIATGS